MFRISKTGYNERKQNTGIVAKSKYGYSDTVIHDSEGRFSKTGHSD